MLRGLMQDMKNMVSRDLIEKGLEICKEDYSITHSIHGLVWTDEIDWQKEGLDMVFSMLNQPHVLLVLISTKDFSRQMLLESEDILN